ncbi:MAG: ABC transporter permease [Actinobacteria bacterium]|nr:ABC transporter permease [Actinomycetota bacterium]
MTTLWRIYTVPSSIPRAASGVPAHLSRRAFLPETASLIRTEIEKQLPRPRTWLTLVFMAFIPFLITVAFALGGTAHTSQPSIAGDFLLVATRSGLDMPLATLDATAPFLLVVAVSLFLGEAITSETGWGFLRALLSKPVSRSRLLLSKALTGIALSAIACLVVALFGLIAGVVAFGWHPVVTPSGITFSQGATLLKLSVATVYTMWSLASIGSFSLLVSTVTDSTIGAVASGIGLAIVSEILDGIPALGQLRVVLPTHYMLAWGELFLQPANYNPMLIGTGVQLPYVIVFCTLAWWWFTRKDILS